MKELVQGILGQIRRRNEGEGMKNMGNSPDGVPSNLLRSMRALFGTALLASCMMASAGEIQRLDRILAFAVFFHEKAVPQDMNQGGQIHFDSDSMRLITEVGRIVIDSGDAGQLADTITAQFAVQSLDQPPSDVLAITMVHDGEGAYEVADESRSAMSDWFADQTNAFVAGNLVLLQVDGLAAADAAIRFDIEGECAICETMETMGTWY